MHNLIFIIGMAFIQPITQATEIHQAVMPKEFEVPTLQPQIIRKSRGKGRGQAPWYAKYL